MEALPCRGPWSPPGGAQCRFIPCGCRLGLEPGGALGGRRRRVPPPGGVGRPSWLGRGPRVQGFEAQPCRDPWPPPGGAPVPNYPGARHFRHTRKCGEDFVWHRRAARKTADTSATLAWLEAKHLGLIRALFRAPPSSDWWKSEAEGLSWRADRRRPGQRHRDCGPWTLGDSVQEALGFFISSDVYGICARIFCDFGDHFEVSDPNGEEVKEIFVQSITKESLEKQLSNPSCLIADFSKPEAPLQLHAAFLALSKFQEQHQRMPRIGGDRYDALRACVGEIMCQKLHRLKVFLVGCGAIGCEMLKNFALLGVSLSGKSGEKPKSTTAAAATLEINPQVKINARLNKVCPATENIYSDEFYSKLDVVVTALDNVEARRYIDSRSVSNQRPLLDSGTMGTKGHTEVIVPNLTESYNSHRDPPEEEIPFCTLKSFPAVIEHTIQWARDKDVSPASIIQILSEVQIPNYTPVEKKIETDENAKKPDHIKLNVSSEEEREAINLLERAISNNTVSKEHLQTTPILFEKDDDSNGHIDFITAASNLRARMYSIESADRFRTKRIAGKIIPAIATATAAVSGLVAVELLKIIAGYGFDSFRNCFFNLALPIIVFTKPAEVRRTQIREGISFSIWDRWTIHGKEDFTLSDFINAVQEKYGIEPTMVVYGVKMLYVPVMPGHNKRLKLAMQKLIKPSSEKKYVDLTVSFPPESDGDEDLPGPPVRYHFSQEDN
ncbi:UBA6 enzyme, partial [Polypterus senegalus]